MMWRSPECKMPKDNAWLMRRLKANESEFNGLYKTLFDEFFSTDGNWYFQKRLRKEWMYIKAQSEKQSVRSKSRWNKEKELSRGNAASGNAPTPTPTPTLLSILSDKESDNSAASDKSLSASPEKKPKKVISKIKFDWNTQKFIDYDYLIETWGEAFPAINIKQELAAAAAWLIANPQNKKSNYSAFLYRWFTRSQDSAGRPVNGYGKPKDTIHEPIEERMKRIREKGLL